MVRAYVMSVCNARVYVKYVMFCMCVRALYMYLFTYGMYLCMDLCNVCSVCFYARYACYVCCVCKYYLLCMYIMHLCMVVCLLCVYLVVRCVCMYV